MTFLLAYPAASSGGGNALAGGFPITQVNFMSGQEVGKG